MALDFHHHLQQVLLGLSVVELSRLDGRISAVASQRLSCPRSGCPAGLLAAMQCAPPRTNRVQHVIAEYGTLCYHRTASRTFLR